MNEFKLNCETSGVRLDKFISDANIDLSRSAAVNLIENGAVLVNDSLVSKKYKLSQGDIVVVNVPDPTPYEAKAENIPLDIVYEDECLLVVNKPKGIVCTTEKRERDNIVDFLKYPERVYPVGRLDKDSEGLILMTNDGELMNEILKARNYHEKEYEVTINRPVTNAFLKQMSEGVEILDTVTRPCKVKKTGVYTFRIILTQGMNRQIRRMCEACGYRVRELKRLRIMNIHLGDLPTGKYREITGEELSKLEKLAGRKPEGVYHG